VKSLKGVVLTGGLGSLLDPLVRSKKTGICMPSGMNDTARVKEGLIRMFFSRFALVLACPLVHSTVPSDDFEES